MATFDAFYEDYIDFKNYVNDILNSKFKNIVENAEKTLYVRRENKVDENVERQTILEKKVQNLSEENKHLRTEVESYKKVIQLLTIEKSNVTNSWQYVFFFSIWVFFHEHSRITGLQGKGEGISFTPHYHFHPLDRHLGISRAITAGSSPLHIASSRARTGNFLSPSASR